MVSAAFKDIPLIPGVFVVMTIFTCLVFSTTTKKQHGASNVDSASNSRSCWQYQQRILLGLGTVWTILLSICTSYGLLWIIGMCTLYAVSSLLNSVLEGGPHIVCLFFTRRTIHKFDTDSSFHPVWHW
jgi:cellobiose-specific phosphotransferase system component IIC